jgi:hypothetical protein
MSPESQKGRPTGSLADLGGRWRVTIARRSQSNAALRSVVAQIGAEVQSVRSLNQRQLRACLYAIEHNF